MRRWTAISVAAERICGFAKQSIKPRPAKGGRHESEVDRQTNLFASNGDWRRRHAPRFVSEVVVVRTRANATGDSDSEFLYSDCARRNRDDSREESGDWSGSKNLSA